MQVPGIRQLREAGDLLALAVHGDLCCSHDGVHTRHFTAGQRDGLSIGCDRVDVRASDGVGESKHIVETCRNELITSDKQACDLATVRSVVQTLFVLRRDLIGQGARCVTHHDHSIMTARVNAASSRVHVEGRDTGLVPLDHRGRASDIERLENVQIAVQRHRHNPASRPQYGVLHISHVRAVSCLERLFTRESGQVPDLQRLVARCSHDLAVIRTKGDSINGASVRVRNISRRLPGGAIIQLDLLVRTYRHDCVAVVGVAD